MCLTEGKSNKNSNAQDKILELIQNLDSWSFNKFAEYFLQKSGFAQVTITTRTKDSNIRGYGRYKINGMLGFTVAFQFQRYNNNPVDIDAIKCFRGSLTTDIEKAIFITTGTFSEEAKQEAFCFGKKWLDLMDAEDLITKINELGISAKELSAR